MKFTDLRAGYTIWVDYHGAHPGVVVEVGSEVITVLYGSHTARPHMAEFCIQPQSPTGKLLGLTSPTYFNSTRIAVIRDASLIRRVGKRCPPIVFSRLWELFVEGAAIWAKAKPAPAPSSETHREAESVPAATASAGADAADESDAGSVPARTGAPPRSD